MNVKEENLEFYSVQACRYVMGEYFSGLGAKPESFSDPEFRGHLPAVYSVIQNTQNLICWDAYLRQFASIHRKGWTKKERRIDELKYDNVFETDLDHLISGACIVAHVYDPRKRGLTDENRILRTRAILMFLLHETDELIAGDKTPDEQDYATAKEAAIHPARILLQDTYGASEILLHIWDEFNARGTDLAKNIDLIDHESAVHKGSLYDWEFPHSTSPGLAREFGTYYRREHDKHPDVGVLQHYSAEQALRALPFFNSHGKLPLIKMLRQNWQDTKRFGDSLKQHDPGFVLELSNRVLERFSCLLPE